MFLQSPKTSLSVGRTWLCAALLGLVPTALAAGAPAAGTIFTVAGGGSIAGTAANANLAVNAQLSAVVDLAVDSSGVIYLINAGSYLVQSVNPATGLITDIAGTGSAGSQGSGDGGQATLASFANLQGIAVDAAGNVYVTDSSSVRKITKATGNISTVAGNSTTTSWTGGNIPATTAGLANPVHLATDSAGNLYIMDGYYGAVRKVDTSGIITNFAGGGSLAGTAADGGPATAAMFNQIGNGVAADSGGNVYITDYYDALVRKVNPAGTISTIAGNGTAGDSGDGGPATLAEVNAPSAIAVDGNGNVFIACTTSDTIREIVASSGNITLVAGTAGTAAYSGDGGPASLAALHYPEGVAVDGSGDVFVADTSNNVVRLVYGSGAAWIPTPAPTPTVSPTVTISPTISPTFSATATATPAPTPGLGAGPVYVADTANNRILEHVNGSWTVLAGVSGTAVGQFLSPSAAAVDAAGNLWVVDSGNNRVQELSDGAWFSFSDGFTSPNGLALDRSGNLYVADTGNGRVVEYSRYQWTVLGNGQGSPGAPGYFMHPAGVAVDPSGNVWVADTGNSQVQELNSDGWFIIASSGTGPGTFQAPTGVVADPFGNVFVTDSQAGTVEEYTSAQAWTVLGTYGSVTQGAQGGLFLSPQQPSVDADGRLWVGDAGNNRIQEFAAGGWNTYASAGPGIGAFAAPAGVAAGAPGAAPTPTATATLVAGPIFVSDKADNRILEFKNGQWTQFAGPSGPDGLGLDGSGNLYAAMDPGNVIQEFSAATGAVLGGWSADGGAYPGVPQDVAVDPAGDMWVAYVSSGGIVELTSPALGPVGTVSIAGTGTALGQVSNPGGIAVDPFGNVFVSDSGNNRVVEYNVTNTAWSLVAGPGAALGQFANPGGLSFDAAGDLLVADSGNNRVQEFYRGAWRAMGSAGTAPGEFNSPMFIKADSGGHLWVSDNGNSRIQEFDPATSAWTAYASFGAFPSFRPYGIVVGPSNPSILPTPVATPGCSLGGYYAPGPGAATLGFATMYFEPVSIAAGTVSQISLNLAPLSGDPIAPVGSIVQAGLYYDDGLGDPGELIANSVAVPVSQTGWAAMALTATPALAGGTYWLAVFGTAPFNVSASASVGPVMTLDFDGGAFPSVLGVNAGLALLGGMVNLGQVDINSCPLAPTPVPTVVCGSSGPGSVNMSTYWSQANPIPNMVALPDGGVVVTNGGEGPAQYWFDRIDAAGNVMNDFGSSQFGPAFLSPGQGAFLNGYLYLPDSQEANVYVYDGQGDFQTNFGNLNQNNPSETIAGPGAVATDGTYLYVANTSNNSIAQFDASGDFVTSWSTSAGDTITAMAYSAVTGHLYALDVNYQDIEIYTVTNGVYDSGTYDVVTPGLVSPTVGTLTGLATDGNYVYTASNYQGASVVEQWVDATTTLDPQQQFAAPAGVQSLAAAANTGVLWMGFSSGLVQAVDTCGGASAPSIPAYTPQCGDEIVETDLAQAPAVFGYPPSLSPSASGPILSSALDGSAYFEGYQTATGQYGYAHVAANGGILSFNPSSQAPQFQAQSVMLGAYIYSVTNTAFAGVSVVDPAASISAPALVTAGAFAEVVSPVAVATDGAALWVVGSYTPDGGVTYVNTVYRYDVTNQGGTIHTLMLGQWPLSNTDQPTGVSYASGFLFVLDGPDDVDMYDSLGNYVGSWSTTGADWQSIGADNTCVYLGDPLYQEIFVYQYANTGGDDPYLSTALPFPSIQGLAVQPGSSVLWALDEQNFAGAFDVCGGPSGSTTPSWGNTVPTPVGTPGCSQGGQYFSGGSDAFYSKEIYFTPLSVTSGLAVVSISLGSGNSNQDESAVPSQFQCALYADDGNGNPGQLIGTSSVGTFTNNMYSTSTWTSMPIGGPNGVTLPASGLVWVAFTGTANLYYLQVNPDAYSDFRVLDYAGGPFPNQVGSAALDEGAATFNSIEVDLNSCALAPGPTPVPAVCDSVGAVNVNVPSLIDSVGALNPLAAAPDGSVFGGLGLGTVVQLDSAGNFMTSFSDGPGQPYGQLAVAGGRLYATIPNYNQVIVTDLAGNQIYLGGFSNGSLGLGAQLNGPSGIASDGAFLFVANSGTNQILQFDLNGDYISAISTLPGDDIIALAWGKGTLYALDAANNQIEAFPGASDADFYSWSVAGFDGPATAVATDGTYVYVVGNASIDQMDDSDPQNVAVLANLNSINETGAVFSIAALPGSGVIWAGDLSGNLTEYAVCGGTAAAPRPTPVPSCGQIATVLDPWADSYQTYQYNNGPVLNPADGSLYFMLGNPQIAGDVIMHYDGAGNFLGSLGFAWSSQAEFGQGVMLNGLIYAPNPNSGQVVSLRRRGVSGPTPINALDPGTGLQPDVTAAFQEVNAPAAVASDGSSLYVADSYSTVIDQYQVSLSQTGSVETQLLNQWTPEGTGALGAIAWASGYIFVADNSTASDNIDMYTAAGAYLGSWTGTLTGSIVNSIAADNQFVYVVDPGGTVNQFDYTVGGTPPLVQSFTLPFIGNTAQAEILPGTPGLWVGFNTPESESLEYLVCGPSQPVPTATPVIPTPTWSSTSTQSPTVTASPTASPSFTASPVDSTTVSPTVTPTPSATASASPTGTPSASPTGTPSASPSATSSASPSATSSASPSPTVSATATNSLTASASPTASPTMTVSATATASASASASATQSPSPAPTGTVSPLGTGTGSVTASPTISATPTATQSYTPSPTETDSPTATFTPCYQAPLAGSGVAGSTYNGVSGPAAQLGSPAGLAWGPASQGQASLYIADSADNAVLALAPNGIIQALTGTAGLASGPQGLLVDAAGVVYIADTGNNRVVRVDALGNTAVVAGGNGFGFAGDDGPAVSAKLASPTALALDGLGNLYIADWGNARVREVSVVSGTAMISTVAGSGTPTASTVSGAALSVNLSPQGLAAGPAGDLYVADAANSLVWHVTPQGQASVAAGKLGQAAVSADGQQAAGSPISGPAGVALDAAGTLYFTENQGTPKVRSVRNGALGTDGVFSGTLGGLAVGPAGLAVAVPGSHVATLLGACAPSYTAPALPLCSLSQLEAFQSKLGARSAVPTWHPQTWAPLAVPNPARAGGSVCVSFQAPVTKGRLVLYTLDGRALGAWPAQGSLSCVPAPASPGIYFLSSQVLDQDGGAHADIRKIAVLP